MTRFPLFLKVCDARNGGLYRSTGGLGGHCSVGLTCLRLDDPSRAAEGECPRHDVTLGPAARRMAPVGHAACVSFRSPWLDDQALALTASLAVSAGGGRVKAGLRSPLPVWAAMFANVLALSGSADLIPHPHDDRPNGPAGSLNPGLPLARGQSPRRDSAKPLPDLADRAGRRRPRGEHQ